MAKNSKDEVTLITGDGRRYRLRFKIAKITTPPDTPDTPVFVICDNEISLGFKVDEVRRRAKRGPGQA